MKRLSPSRLALCYLHLPAFGGVLSSFALLAVLVDLARAEAPPVLWKPLTEAVGDIVAGRHAAAITILGRARQAADMPELDALVGIAALAAGHLKSSHQHLERAIRRGSAEPQVFYWAARAAWLMRRHSLARIRIEQATALAPANVAIRAAQAILVGARAKKAARNALEVTLRQQASLRDPRLYPVAEEGAVLLLSSLLHKFPHTRHLLRTRGHLFWQLGRVMAALTNFNQLLKVLPNDADALRMIARCQEAFGKFDQALATAKRAHQANVDYPEALATLGRLLLQRGHAESAKPLLRKAADARPTDAGILLNWGIACSKVGDATCAIRAFKYATLRNAKLSGGYRGLAEELATSDRQRAKLNYQRALDLAPNDPELHLAAATFAKRLGDIPWERRLLRRSRRLVRVARRLTKRRERLLRKAQLTLAALKACDCPIVGSLACHAPSPDCRKSLSALPPDERRTFRVHLKLVAGERVSPQSFGTILSWLRNQRLLVRDPVALITQWPKSHIGKDKRGASITKTTLPLAIDRH